MDLRLADKVVVVTGAAGQPSEPQLPHEPRRPRRVDGRETRHNVLSPGEPHVRDR